MSAVAPAGGATPDRREARAVRLEFGAGNPVCADLSAAACAGDWLWVAGDEACGVNCLQRLDARGAEALRYGAVRYFPLGQLLELPGADGDEADLEGMAIADGCLWVVGSHGLKRRRAKRALDDAANADRLARVALEPNRLLLACLPIEAGADGRPTLVARAGDGRRARRLNGGARANALLRLLRKDPHLGPYLGIPGKDNGFDVEGLAVVDGGRLLLGLRGPVLRGWSALLEIAVEPRKGGLRLAPLDGGAQRLRKHFLQLDGLGIRDLHFSGDDLYLLAGPTMALDGEIRVYRWPDARHVLAANREPVRFERLLVETMALPHGRGRDRAEALCELPRAQGNGLRRWLVLYDAPGDDRRDGDGSVLGDLLHRER